MARRSHGTATAGRLPSPVADASLFHLAPTRLENGGWSVAKWPESSHSLAVS